MLVVLLSIFYTLFHGLDFVMYDMVYEVTQFLLENQISFLSTIVAQF